MRESRTLEYKENLSSNTFLKTISAYANYGEGKIIFGINDQGNIIGITDPVNGCLNLENKINDSLSPVPEFRLEIQENTIVLTVYEGRYKPYLYKGKAYKRNDSSTVEVDRLEYNRLILEGCNQTFEEITSFNQQLTFAKLETEFIRVMGIEKINKDILKTLELYSDQSGFNNAAALLADDNQFTGIDIIRFGDTI
ncbi:AAA family ATPase, partial [Blautia wexlerae]